MNYKEIVEDLVNKGADNIKKKTVILNGEVEFQKEANVLKYYENKRGKITEFMWKYIAEIKMSIKEVSAAITQTLTQNLTNLTEHKKIQLRFYG